MTEDASPPADQPRYGTWQAAARWVPPPPATPFVDPMSDRTAARAIVAAIAAGILAQLLFAQQAAGINFLLWSAVVIGAAYTLKRPDARLDRYDLWMPPAALAFAGFIALRDDMGLLAFDVLATASLTVASAVAIGGQPVSRRAPARIVELGWAAVEVFFGGAIRIAHGFRPLAAAVPSSGHETSARVFRGLLIAVPLVVGFVLLFAAADGVFQSMFRSLLDVRLDVSDLIGRLIFGFAAAWLFAGTMAAVWMSRARFPAEVATDRAAERRSKLGTVETLVVLVALDVVFALFVAVQAAYLFPGSDPLGVSGMSYAEYARRGFFELVIVAILSAFVILALDAFVERKTWAYKAASAVLAALTGFVLVSAAVRLMLYQQAYGWTELRFYVLAAIALLAAGVVATVVLLIRGRVSFLPKFMFGAGLAVALACNVVGPQEFVTTQNLARAVNPALVTDGGYRLLDTFYLESLGVDSIPVVIANLNGLPAQDANYLRSALRSRAQRLRNASTERGWPSWNLSRQRALDALTAAGY